MLIENAPVVRKKNPAAGAFVDKIFQIYKSDRNTRKKGLHSEAKIHYLECTSVGVLTDEELQKGINERTRLVAVAQVSNVLGCVNPIQKITEMAHRVGAVFAPVPQKFEAGTVNAAGAVGLAAAIRYLQEKGFDYIQKKELELTQRDMEGLGALPYVHILGSKDPANHTGIVSFTI